MSTPLIAIVGPTAVGKSALSQELAQKFNAEIINCDSRLFYRGLDIGTSKPKYFIVPHHMIDCVEPNEPYDVAAFYKMATQKIEDIRAAQKNVFIVGGSGFYLRALSKGMYQAPPASLKIREELNEKATDDLYKKLENIDPESAKVIHPHDRYRIIRALEVYLISSKTLSSIKQEFEKRKKDSCLRRNDKREIHIIGLMRPKEELNVLIKQRTQEMIKEGLEEEVKGLLKKWTPDISPLQSIGYKQMISYLRGNVDKPQCIEEIEKETRKLAKRQMTWFRKETNIQWFHPELDRDKIHDFIIKCMKGFSNERPISSF